MPPVNDDAGLREILVAARSIAVVGYSESSWRPSRQVAEYLRGAGYTIYPVNPQAVRIDGRTCYPDLASVPGPIDIVDVFRRSEFVPEVVEQAIAVGARVLWLQLDVVHREAARRAEEAGMRVVMNRCIAVDHRRLLH